ncbi:Ig-like domain-containing protein [Litorilituus lipolyticus]|uniref:Big-1 domain-containing protein n=1 Tax=Litorilituus lipolyticus TaxID=2491017 RepID=A0A502L4C3_9GAMM|nr:Ig-like domain-containing protein [Litorilituus lipolyticus]TPH17091.1 hypothetical protein EPA86_05250 [Litorilituus lipolyticus]
MQLLRRLSFTMLLMSLMTLVACGGSGGDLSGGGGGGGTDTYTIEVSKSDGDLSGTNDVVVSALVKQGNSPVASKLVTFSLTDETLATFSPAAGTAVTDANGVASITVKATSLAGGVEVTAEISEADPVSIGFNSTGGGTGGEGDALAISLSMTSKEVSASNPPTITATVTYGGQAVADQLVTFSVDNSDLASFLPETGTASTNEQGVATIVVTAAGTAGAGTISASINGVTLASTTFNSLGDGNEGGSPDVANISLFASSQQLASSGAQEIVLTAIAKDINNNLLEGVAISFAADSGALEKIDDTNVTGSDGRVAVKLTTVAEPTNRIISTSATSGAVMDSLEIQVLGTSVSLTGSTSLALDDNNSYIVKVLDSDGTAISNVDVTLSLTNESTETPSGEVATIELPTSVTTDFSGQANVIVKGTSGGTNTIVAEALGAITSQSVAVQADSFLFTDFGDGMNNVNPSGSPSPVIPDILLSKTATVSLTWLRSGVIVPDGTVVNFSTTRGSLSSTSASTVNGVVTTTLTSTNAGKALVTFTGSDTVDGKSIELSNQLEFEFVADTASRIIAQAFPKSIGPNEQTSTISVVLRDPQGNLVKNKTIDFVLTDVSGGSIFPATAVTDSNGAASTVYTSKNTSAQNAIKISASVRGTAPVVTDEVSLTVSDRELFISLGTGNSVAELGTTDYVKEYSVFVTDADSNPVNNVDLTISAIPHRYYKGYWAAGLDEEGEFVRWITRGADALEVWVGLTPPPTSPNLPAKRCENEDLNLDGILDVGEDYNGDEMLTPGNVVSANGTITTDESGRAVVQIIYSKSYGEWLDVKLIASTKVNGSESSTQTIFNLPTLAADVVNEDIVPPLQGIGMRGPFGLLNDCSLNISEDPNIDGTP